MQDQTPIRTMMIGMRVEVEKVRDRLRMAFAACGETVRARCQLAVRIVEGENVVSAMAVRAFRAGNVPEVGQFPMHADAIAAEQIDVAIAAAVC